MKLYPPLIITSRLMPGLQIGNATIRLGYGARSSDNRMVYQCWIDLPDGTEHEITDLRSGRGGGDIQDGIASLLSFLRAAVESRYWRVRTGHKGTTEYLFPPAVVDWATENSDELAMLACELEEAPGLVEV